MAGRVERHRIHLHEDVALIEATLHDERFPVFLDSREEFSTHPKSGRAVTRRLLDPGQSEEQLARGFKRDFPAFGHP